MKEKSKILKEIKELWQSTNIQDFDIAPELLEYLELSDLQELKANILQSKKELTEEQKDWLFQFRKY